MSFIKSTFIASLLTLAFGLAVNSHAQSFLTNGLVAYFPFNGNANDASGNGHNGTVAGATLTTDRFGQTNQAYLFGGTSAYITVPLSGSVFTSDFTASVWFKANDIANSWPTLFDQQVMAPGTTPFRLVIGGLACGCAGPGHLIAYAGYPGPSFNWFLDRSQQTPIATYCQVIVTKAGTNMTMFLNSEPTVTGLVSSPITQETGNTLWIGRSAIQDVLGGYVFHGVLDDIRIYNRALSAGEVTMLYEYESGPRVNLIKAVKPSFTGLNIGTNYQMQVSTDLVNWTNSGSAFTATNSSMVYPQYFDVLDWSQLYFRLH